MFQSHYDRLTATLDRVRSAYPPLEFAYSIEYRGGTYFQPQSANNQHTTALIHAARFSDKSTAEMIAVASGGTVIQVVACSVYGWRKQGE